jgi:hypothetical protein
MRDPNESFLSRFQLRAVVAALAFTCLSIAGCDQAEGLLDEAKKQIADDPAPPTVTPAAPAADVVVPPTPIVPAGPTPEQIVTQFKALRPDQITDDSLSQLASSPEAAAAITEVDMQGAQVSGTGLAALQGLPNLQSLSVGGPHITADALAAVGKAQSLKSIDLSNSAANDRVVSELSQIPHLQTLNLQGTQVTGGSATALSAMHELVDLSLLGTSADDQTVQGLAALPLRRLDLSRTGITDASLPVILKIQTLESLNVSFCQVTGNGFKGFNKSSLKELAVGETRFGVEGLMAIKGMKSLENLNIYSAGLVEHKSANVFRTFPNLKILNASRNQVTDAGMTVFFKGHKTLEELHLQYNRGITDNGLGALIAVKTLKSLDVTSTGCGAAGANKLKEYLPECEVKTSN